MDAGYPRSPEIDFAENGGQTNSRKGVTVTLHYGTDNSQIQRSVRADFTRWHVVGAQSTAGLLVCTFDGQRWATVHGGAVPSQPTEMDIQAQAGTCGDRYAPAPTPPPRHE